MIVITYWADNDPDTIATVMCANDTHATQIQAILARYGMDIMYAGPLDTITPDELENMFADVYGG